MGGDSAVNALCCAERRAKVVQQRAMSRKNRFRRPQKGKESAERLQRAFEQALHFHRAGDAVEAGRLYDEILELRADHLGALHLSGVLHLEQNRPECAAKVLLPASCLAPDVAPLQLCYGVALLELGRSEDALVLFQKAACIDPLYAEAFYHLANGLKDLGRYARACVVYDRVLALEPDHADAWSNQGDALQSIGLFEEAVGRYEKALTIRADYAQAFSNCGLALHNMRRFDAALHHYDRAIGLKPDFGVAWFNRANTLKDLQRFDDAVADFAIALLLEPEDAQASSNQGDALQALGRFDEALAAYDKALLAQPDFAQACSNRGVCLKELGRFEDALASFDGAISFDPDYAEAFWNKALTLLLLGRFEEGWELYEWRKKTREPVGNRLFPRPVWLGQEDVAHKTLLVHAEQGLGDVIQFSRYVRCLVERGAKVLFAPGEALQALMRTLDGDVRIVDAEDAALNFDYHVPLLSLPFALKTNATNIPAGPSYLRAQAKLAQSWMARLGPEGFKVGICWQGGVSPVDVGRSFPLRLFFELSQIPGVRLISLQKGPGALQLQHLPAGMQVQTPGQDFDAGPDAFLDTAAVMTCCDLVITSDTAVAHLAGALGVKTWVALKHVPDWRWFLQRDDSPRYPSLRLFRQESPGDWDGVFARIKAALLEAVAAIPSVRESGSAP